MATSHRNGNPAASVTAVTPGLHGLLRKGGGPRQADQDIWGCHGGQVPYAGIREYEGVGICRWHKSQEGHGKCYVVQAGEKLTEVGVISDFPPTFHCFAGGKLKGNIGNCSNVIITRWASSAHIRITCFWCNNTKFCRLS